MTKEIEVLAACFLTCVFVLANAHEVKSEEDISGLWVSAITGETIKIAKSSFSQSQFGDGAFEVTAEKGGNFKFNYQRGFSCIYRIAMIRGGIALSWSLRDGPSDCPKGLFERVVVDTQNYGDRTPSPPRANEPATSVVVESITFTKDVNAQCRGRVAVAYRSARGLTELQIPFKRACSVPEALAEARASLKEMGESISLIDSALSKF